LPGRVAPCESRRAPYPVRPPVDGRIAEAGSHAELVAAGGTYAELYDLQAAAYR